MIHGIYCDEFAEYHTRDMAVQALLGGFPARRGRRNRVPAGRARTAGGGGRESLVRTGST